MNDKKTTIPEAELSDDRLDAVSGGVKRDGDHNASKQTACKRCGNPFPSKQLYGGYCGTCIEELHRQGVYPPI